MVGETLQKLLMTAWLLPLLGFVVEIFFGYWSKNPRHSKAAAWMAVGCIGTGFLCSLTALVMWGNASNAFDDGDRLGWMSQQAAENEARHPGHDTGHGHESGDHAEELERGQTVYSGTIYTLGVFGSLEVTLDYYIDSLTLVMFTMVTLIATCIHLFAIGYMSDELTDEYVDHSAHTSDGGHVHRPGRFYRFFAFMSLFCFAMLGLVLAGNIFQVFIFWELVGICSYLLIGFYTERKTASDAANKAFIMNRIGDFGFLIGLMVLWTFFGTFRFGDTVDDTGQVDQGLFSMVHRDETGNLARDEFTGDVLITDTHGHVLTNEDGDRQIPYYLLVVVGLGVFAGCVGKSAQFPLQTWLPDAMEGPTPVSALVHSATMVAAGVYLAGRFFPMFVQEVLLTIAYTGCITLFLAATIAMVATDIKKVLAYSTISQLGYMMLGIGVFGWAAGLFHLITHAFFKSLMFLCSGSVIYGCHHEQEMTKMGGLLKKMPITAITMLVGVIAISGLAIPGVLAFSGYHSKDAIVASALAFVDANPVHYLLFLVPLLTAGITAFYMFRLWFYTFCGTPRDQHVHDHAHESPWIMTAPLIILSVFAAFCAVGGDHGNLYILLTGDEPAHLEAGVAAVGDGVTLPGIQKIVDQHKSAGRWALFAAFSGALVAFVLYGTNVVNVEDIKRQLAGVHGFLANKWHFDDLYDALFMKPAHKVAAFCAWFDGAILDRILHGAAKAMVLVSKWDRVFDETVVDGFVNLMASATQSVGASLKVVQTGRLRQYVMFIVLGVVALFAVMFSTFPR
ncbi:MAG TPA: NADH-quinone oxidoreductase subunit L [Planctomycetes bacterium]|nr:NADH-quinone oxidoreductase subunit L [Planctomycetota bacterium]